MRASNAYLREDGEPEPGRLTPVTASDLLQMKFPPRENVLAPWLPSKGLAMLYAPRGAGKTLVSLGVAYAVASGCSFLGGRWSAPKPRRVLFVDGEMPGIVLQDRLINIADKAEAEPPADDFFRLLAADLEPEGIPDLSTLDGQSILLDHIGDAELIVLDNLSTLCRSGRANEEESWVTVQEFLLRLRRESRSVLLVHHAAKSGAQRGTSKKEDVLDTVVNLKRPDDYKATEGARFIVSFEKARGFYGPDAEPFEASLDMETGVWSCRDLEDVRANRVVELTREGMNQTEIAGELGVNKSTVSRIAAKLKSEGRL